MSPEVKGAIIGALIAGLCSAAVWLVMLGEQYAYWKEIRDAHAENQVINLPVPPNNTYVQCGKTVQLEHITTATDDPSLGPVFLGGKDATRQTDEVVLRAGAGETLAAEHTIDWIVRCVGEPAE